MRKSATLLSLLFLCVAGFSPEVFAQQTEEKNEQTEYIRCGTMEADSALRQKHTYLGDLDAFEQWLAPFVEMEKQRMADPSRSTEILTIPVVIHIVHNGDAVGSGENISDAQAISQITVLNEDFRRLTGTRGFNNDPDGADTYIEFCLAQSDPSGNPTTGINRVNGGQASWTQGQIESTLKPATQWDPTQYLNMWTVRFGGGSSSLLGYAQFPEANNVAGVCDGNGAANTDGLVMVYNAFGSLDYDDGSFTMNATYQYGRTATHEIGHGFGLRHIWGDGGCGVDDFCDDTPVSDAANYGCPSHTSCSTQDMVENYMDYTTDACMNIFTNDQAARMRATLLNSTRRQELLASTKCSAPAPIISFTESSSSLYEGTSCNGQIVAYTLEITDAPSANATVTFSTSGTATGGSTDFAISPSSLVFPAGSSANQTIYVRVTDDGSYEGNETLNIDFTVTTAGDAQGAENEFGTLNITIIDDEDDPAPTVDRTILNADFEDDFDSFTTSGNGSSDQWQLGVADCASSSYWTINGSNGGIFAYTNDDNCNCDKGNDQIISPVFSLQGAGYTAATLSFDQAFANVGNESADVLITTNGSAWSTLTTITNTSTNNGGGQYTTPWVTETVDLTPYLGSKTVQIAFRYNDDGDWAYGMAVDNISVTAQRTIGVATSVNTTYKDTAAIEPNATVDYYDPVSGAYMARIQNLGGHDYGCTRVSIDRDETAAGGTTSAFWNNETANRLLAKTIMVEPNNNNASGNYTITLFYTEAEIAAWEAATGQSRNDIELVKVSSNPIGDVTTSNYNGYSVESQPATVTPWGGQVALTATFTSGFSGFGAGIAGTPLPIELTSFEGTARDASVMLEWHTQSELNNKMFAIERSADGEQFETIGTMLGAGTTNVPQQYSFLDAKPYKGYNYYRLRQVDYDGTSSYSHIELVSFAPEAFESLTLAPNPVEEQLQITLQGMADAPATITVIDALGKVVEQRNNVALSSGSANLSIDMRAHPDGFYYIRVLQGGSTYSKKFFKH